METLQLAEISGLLCLCVGIIVIFAISHSVEPLHWQEPLLLESLAQVVLSNRVALDDLLVAQGRVCAVANTCCFTWIYKSWQAELRITRLFKLAKSLKGHSSFMPLWLT